VALPTFEWVKHSDFTSKNPPVTPEIQPFLEPWAG